MLSRLTFGIVSIASLTLMVSACGDITSQDLEEERAAIAASVDTTCMAATDCAFMLYGEDECGEPSAYVVYAKAGTDEADLRSKTDDYTGLERDFHDRKDGNSRVSICIPVQGPSELFCRSGVCTDR